jgi:4-amino-4-deoxy-L-arabinose transferase-like glycosyltransferase
LNAPDDESAGPRALLGALLVVAGLHLVGLGQPPLLEPDEGRYADVAREFLHASSLGDWVLPHANGVPFLDKPPLVCWLAALLMHLLGPCALALRLVPAFSGILAAGVAASFARAVYGRGAAPLAAIVYGTAPLALGVGRTFTLDVPLTALVALGLLETLKGAGLLGGRPSHARSALAGVAIGLAALVKGPVAIGLVGMGVVVALALRWRSPERWRLLSPLPFVVAVLVAAPWYALVCREAPGFATTFFLEENLQRFAAPAVEHKELPVFFLGVLLWGLGPWTLVSSVLAWAAWRTREKPTEPGRAILLIYAACVVLFFSASSTKLATYILPAFPILAAVIGGELSRVLDDPRSPARRPLGYVLGLMTGLLLLVPVLGLAFALVPLPFHDEKVELARAATSPLLALLPLPVGALAAWLARQGRARAAILALAATLVVAIPFVMGPFAALALPKSAKGAADAILARATPGVPPKVASYHHYYRGLPFYLDAPVVLLGEKGELRIEAFEKRNELYFPDLYFALEDGRVIAEDCWTRAFLASNRGVFVVVPTGQKRAERFLTACERAGVSVSPGIACGEDLVFQVLP